MINLTLHEIADIAGSTTTAPATRIHGLSIDTRTLQKNNLFIALSGARVDGHALLNEARDKGAGAALVSQPPVSGSLPQIQVEDVIQALGKIASHWRQQFHLPLIAVTGSNGKTTLKNMIAAILTAACQGQTEQVLATQGNLNNHIGLPLTLARLNSQHRYAVVEMGMNHFGEIAYLSKLAKPQVAVITNAAAAHLEGVGDIAGVAKAKSEIFAGLSDHGKAILNRDDAYYPFWREKITHRNYLTFGLHPDADIRATLQSAGTTQQVTVFTPAGEIQVHLPLLGRHNIFNMLAATASTLAVGIPLELIKTGLESIQPTPGRLQLHRLPNGVNVIDDTYNANPVSLQAAINTLASFTGKRILVLGDMKELGAAERDLHQSAGELIRQAGIDYLFTFGELTAHTSQAFGEGAYHFEEQDKLVHAVKALLHAETTILVKGSRSMKMENVVAGLVN